MKLFSMLSLLFIAIGIMTYGVSRNAGELTELFILLGFISLFITIILGFVAMTKKEAGKLKYLSIMMAFLMLGVITWAEPFQIVRVLTWLKNA